VWPVDGPVRERGLWGFGFKLGAFAVGLFALGAIGIVAAGVALAHALSGPWLSFSIGPAPRLHLAPIPISESACPAVKQIHDAANEFQLFIPFFGAAAADGRYNDWPREKQQLGQAAGRLALTIAFNERRFPVPVQERMRDVIDSLGAGRAQLLKSPDAADFVNHIYPDSGWQEFGEASDLIGKQCRVPLAADNWTSAFSAFSTTVPTTHS
jgi:hypothetical protein